jgi:hypothetical protein
LGDGTCEPCAGHNEREKLDEKISELMADRDRQEGALARDLSSARSKAKAAEAALEGAEVSAPLAFGANRGCDMVCGLVGCCGLNKSFAVCCSRRIRDECWLANKATERAKTDHCVYF